MKNQIKPPRIRRRRTRDKTPAVQRPTGTSLMFTRCPQCKTVHPLSAAAISHARGLVQCGQCNRTFSALSFLFDEWPTGEAHRPAKGPDTAVPVLEAKKKDSNLTVKPATEEEESESAVNKHWRLAWNLATVFLVILTITNIVWTFRAPLLENPRVSVWMNQAGWSQADQPEGLLKDPGKVQLVSRDMHTHPTRSGILVLSLTFVNLATRNQEFPILEVTLMDAANQPVAQRRLQPIDYLRPGANTQPGLAADVFLPVLLELGDPGDQAVGFEIRFL
jgi:predicted Zn finger-like uncharacterized protein